MKKVLPKLSEIEHNVPLARCGNERKSISGNEGKSLDFRASASRKPNSNSRYIPKALRSKILQKGCCENCKTTKNLQIDHIKPFALGGKTTLENLRLLCQSCNIAKGVKIFGHQKMRILEQV